MIGRLMMCVAVLVLAAGPALGGTASKDGSWNDAVPSVHGAPSAWRADFEYNTAGSIDYVPATGGSSDGWAEYFVAPVQNATGHKLHLVELGFPCAGPPSPTYGWLVWVNLGGYAPPAGDPTTADHFGPLTPVDSNPLTFPPTTYTYVDISAQSIIINAGETFGIGYDNTGMGGMLLFNGTETWGWYAGAWDSDQPWGRTAVLQVKASFFDTPVEATTWGTLKALFQ
jgi:hypothetical protein